MVEAARKVERAPGVRKRRRKSAFFTVVGLLLITLTIAGFWPQYFSAVTGRTPAENAQFWLIHLHSALFTGWLLLYIFQAALIVTGRARLHIEAGPWLAGYGFAIAVLGIFASVALARRLGVRENDFDLAASFVFFPLVDMAFFAGFLAAAVIWRKTPHLHKRAMLLATFSIAVVGLGRLVARMPFESAFIWQPLTLAPLIIATAYDIFICRRLYPIMAIGLLAHLARLNAEPFTPKRALAADRSIADRRHGRCAAERGGIAFLHLLRSRLCPWLRFDVAVRGPLSPGA